MACLPFWTHPQLYLALTIICVIIWLLGVKCGKTCYTFLALLHGWSLCPPLPPSPQWPLAARVPLLTVLWFCCKHSAFEKGKVGKIYPQRFTGNNFCNSTKKKLHRQRKPNIRDEFHWGPFASAAGLKTGRGQRTPLWAALFSRWPIFIMLLLRNSVLCLVLGSVGDLHQQKWYLFG